MLHKGASRVKPASGVEAVPPGACGFVPLPLVGRARRYALIFVITLDGGDDAGLPTRRRSCGR